MVIKWFVNWPPLYPFSDGHFRHLPLPKGECKAIRRFRKLSGPEQGGDKTRRLSFQAVLQTWYILLVSQFSALSQMISGNSHIMWVPLQQVGDELPITFLERRHMWSTNPSLWNWSFHDFDAPAKSLSTSVDPGALGLDVGMPGNALSLGKTWRVMSNSVGHLWAETFRSKRRFGGWKTILSSYFIWP